jgi:hypothetical protein
MIDGRSVKNICPAFLQVCFLLSWIHHAKGILLCMWWLLGSQDPVPLEIQKYLCSNDKLSESL